MGSVLIALIMSACAVGGMLFGMLLRRLLPDHHLKDESKDVLKTASGLIATLVALVLALLVSSSKGTYDAMNEGLTQSGAKIITLYRILVRYGPETEDTRELLRSSVASTIERVWPTDMTKTANVAAVQAATGAEELYESIQNLSPRTDAQRSLRAQALQISTDLQQNRWLLIQQTQGSVPKLFLIILGFWLAVLYISFGLFAPPHATPILALIIGALSVSAAVFLVLEMSHPLQGVMKVSCAPLQMALALMAR